MKDLSAETCFLHLETIVSNARGTEILDHHVLVTFVLVRALQVIHRNKLSQCFLERIRPEDVNTEIQHVVESVAVVSTGQACDSGPQFPSENLMHPGSDGKLVIKFTVIGRMSTRM